jgi:hypothetical protein
MSLFYRTLDIKNLVARLGEQQQCDSRLPALLQQSPVESNYLIENTIANGRITGRVIEVFAHSNPSTSPLYQHLQLFGLDSSCYIKLTPEQAEVIVNGHITGYRRLSPVSGGSTSTIGRSGSPQVHAH